MSYLTDGKCWKFVYSNYVMVMQTRQQYRDGDYNIAQNQNEMRDTLMPTCHGTCWRVWRRWWGQSGKSIKAVREETPRGIRPVTQTPFQDTLHWSETTVTIFLLFYPSFFLSFCLFFSSSFSSSSSSSSLNSTIKCLSLQIRARCSKLCLNGSQRSLPRRSPKGPLEGGCSKVPAVPLQ